MRDLDDVFAALQQSAFRRRFRLQAPDRRYVEEKTLKVVCRHAHEFIVERLAPAKPRNDGRQTPMRGHPAFVAQHATATCCRGCLSRWHGIQKGRRLSEEEIEYIVGVLRRWLVQSMGGQPEQRQSTQCPLFPDPPEFPPGAFFT